MSSVALRITQQGPILNAFVSVTAAHTAALQNAGLAVPRPIQVRLLVDTGATSTNICTSIIPAAGLMQTGVVPVHTPSTAGVAVNMPQYDSSLMIPLDDGTWHTVLAMPIICADFSAQGIHGLLGRDVLSRCAMSYHGHMNLCVLSF